MVAETETIHAKYSEEFNRKPYQTKWEELKFKLFTREDPIYAHKILGLLCLISFLYRYAFVFPFRGDLGIDTSYFSFIVMTTHLALSCTSLIFHVIKKRIINRPMIIWEEYRLHAIVFTLRSYSIYIYSLWRPFSVENGWDPSVEYIALYCIIMVHHLVVDEITRRHGSKDYTTVRVKDAYSIGTTAVLRFYAFYQLTGLAGYLVPTEKLGDLSFNAFIAIQSSAFLMTLYRKNLIKSHSHAFWYTSSLILSIYHIFNIHGTSFFLLKVIGVYVLRTQFRMNKYFVWFIFSAVSTPWFLSKIFLEISTYVEFSKLLIPSQLFELMPTTFDDAIMMFNCVLIFTTLAKIVVTGISKQQKQLSVSNTEKKITVK